MPQTLVCEQCVACMINGVFCHEIGCPDSWKFVHQECQWCGFNFEAEEKGQAFCSESCAESYHL
jgi:hypothetical protein